MSSFNQVFQVEHGKQYALDITGKLVLRREVVLRAKEYPNRVEWLGMKRVRVVYSNNCRARISVPSFCEHDCKDGNEAKLPGKSTRVVILVPSVRRSGKSYTGKMKVRSTRTVRTGEVNQLDHVIDRMLTGDLSFEAAWCPAPKIIAFRDESPDTKGRPILVFHEAGSRSRKR